MVRPYRWQIIIGISLLVFGVLLLLQSLEVLPKGGWLWSVPFILAGIAFLFVLFKGRQNWWAVIPGIILLDLGALIALGEFAPDFESTYGGAFFLAGLSLTFLIVYLLNFQNWWALIPAGVMATLSTVTAFEETASFETGTVFFLGLALTFGLLSVLPTGRERMNWPWIPAVSLLGVGALVSIGAEGMTGFVWPTALILGGLFLVIRAFGGRS